MGLFQRNRMINHIKKQLADCRYVWCDIHGMISLYWFLVGLVAGMLI